MSVTITDEEQEAKERTNSVSQKNDQTQAQLQDKLKRRILKFIETRKPHPYSLKQSQSKKQAKKVVNGHDRNGKLNGIKQLIKSNRRKLLKADSDKQSGLNLDDCFSTVRLAKESENITERNSQETVDEKKAQNKHSSKNEYESRDIVN